MIKPNIPTRQDIFVLLVILVVGAVLRFTNLQLIDWSTDQSDMVVIVQDMLAGKGFPLLGQPSSTGLPHSPFYIYILALPYAFSNDPAVATMFIAALNLVGLAILWLLAFRYFGRRVAFITAIAYAVHPWVLGYSRTIWSGDHRQPLIILAVLLGIYGFIEGKRWAQIAFLPIFLIGVQIYYAGYALLPLGLYFLWVGRKQTSLRVLAITAVLGLAVVLPFAIGITQSISNSNAVINPPTADGREWSLRQLAKPVGQIVWLSTGLGYEQYNARANAEDLMANLGIIGWSTALWTLLGLAVLIGMVSVWRRSPRSIAIVILLWMLLPIVFLTLGTGIGIFSSVWIDVVPHYFIPSLAVFSLLAAIGIDWVLALLNRQKIAQMAVWAVFGVIFVSQALFFEGFLDYIDNNYTPTQFGFGTPMHYRVNVTNALEADRDVIFVVSNDWVEFSGTSAHVWEALLPNTVSCIRNVVIEDNFAVFPNGPFAVAFAPRVSPTPLLTQLYQTDNPAVVSLRPGEGEYRIEHFDAAPEWADVSMTAVDPARFDNGVTLTGYRWDDNRLYLEWLLPEATTVNYQYSVSLLDDAGEVISQQENHFWPGFNWCAGDRLVSWLDVEAADSAQTLSVTLFRQSRGGTLVSNLVDDADNTIGASADIPLNES